jgi:hypothetical protein
LTKKNPGFPETSSMALQKQCGQDLKLLRPFFSGSVFSGEKEAGMFSEEDKAEISSDEEDGTSIGKDGEAMSSEGEDVSSGEKE